jgi:hypothetical protein
VELSHADEAHEPGPAPRVPGAGFGREERPQCLVDFEPFGAAGRVMAWADAFRPGVLPAVDGPVAAFHLDVAVVPWVRRAEAHPP